MMRIRYQPVPDRASMFSIYLLGRSVFLVGYTWRVVDGHWAARLRQDPDHLAISGWPRRSDAARWLLIAGEFAREREQERWVA